MTKSISWWIKVCILCCCYVITIFSLFCTHAWWSDDHCVKGKVFVQLAVTKTNCWYSVLQLNRPEERLSVFDSVSDQFDNLETAFGNICNLICVDELTVTTALVELLSSKTELLIWQLRNNYSHALVSWSRPSGLLCWAIMYPILFMCTQSQSKWLWRLTGVG